jgi:hypothetical protein
VLRAATYLGVRDEEIERAIAAIPHALHRSPATKKATATAT